MPTGFINFHSQAIQSKEELTYCIGHQRLNARLDKKDLPVLLFSSMYRDEPSRIIKYSRIILFKFSQARISNPILQFKLAN